MDHGISEAELNQLEEIVVSKVQQRTPPRMNEDTFIAKTFRGHDMSGSGFVDFEKFKRALLPFSSGISDQDLMAIFNRYAQEGQLHYKSFAMDFVSGVRRLPGSLPEGGGEAWESVEDTLMRIKVFLYSQGPVGVIALATAFRNADYQNARSLSFDAFASVMFSFFADTPCHLQDQHVEQVFQVFRQPYAPDQISYDEVFLALKEEPSADRRAAIRGAFRRLDPHSEGLVDINHMLKSFNASRHPQVSDGTRKPEDVIEEFEQTLKDLVAFRRGSRSYPTNLVAWEEFEDYYKFINGCFESDSLFSAILTRVWDLDKSADSAIDGRAAAAAPAAGVPPKSRAGLHHWQANTLPPKHLHHAPQAVNLDEVLLKARAHIAKTGLRGAVEVIKNFYAVDDDVDDLLDVYEFRRACKASKLNFKEAEEAACFEECGTGSGVKGGKLEVPRFLQRLHGPLSQTRLQAIEQAWVALGGELDSEESVLGPAVLKERFAAEAHPYVKKNGLNPEQVVSEFLDSFSLLAHVRGGCQNGMVGYVDFLAYYEVVSSIIDNDAFFVMLMKRLWCDGRDESCSPMAGSVNPGSPRPHKDPYSPTAQRRPPVHNGPSAYGTKVDQHHRRFMRKEMPGGYGDETAPPQAAAPNPAFSPITKSSIVFNDSETGELGVVLGRLRQSVAKRGLRGWKSLAQKFTDHDHRRNGGCMRGDFEKIHRTSGLGLSPEERESLFRGLAAGRKDGAMDYTQCMRRLRGVLPESRQVDVEKLFQSLTQDGSGPVALQFLKDEFHPHNTPHCMLNKKDVRQQHQEFCEAVDYFLDVDGSGSCDLESFMDFFAIVSAVHPEEDDFHLMVTAAFGFES
eukprot:TRINITY_DN92121_c0_g1_i1.p1 TRINITY_DN92121_c0_g1~~TRINITY_DN92121_c0_g1_i1.p1  ORF type:complete len:850 (+),score=211.38 TRINITY_DN92121_c0_g1_i1:154-2703(+)